MGEKETKEVEGTNVLYLYVMPLAEMAYDLVELVIVTGRDSHVYLPGTRDVDGHLKYCRWQPTQGFLSQWVDTIQGELGILVVC